MARLVVFYQYLFPDENVSSVHLSELCSGMAELGWDVTAYPSNRNLEEVQVEYPERDTWRGVKLRRIWRPRVSRSSSLGRVLSAAWMVARWSLLAFRRDPVDVLVVGTDPILSVLIAPAWRLFHSNTRIVHWCFDLYPEAAYADGLIRRGGAIARVIEGLLRPSYAACDLVVDIGSCMRERIQHYGCTWRSSTLVPWALAEPTQLQGSEGAERKSIFGSTRLALMYSGTFGRAHSFEDILALMDQMRGEPAHLAFSVKGQREAALRAAAKNAPNVSFVNFASKDRIDERLAAADIHVVSLRDEWTGMVIPSKFFGALAVGRPILFCGSATSALARWIREYGLGWVLEAGGAAEVAAQLRAFCADASAMQTMRERCFSVYHQQFSRQTTISAWDRELSGLLKGSTSRSSSTIPEEHAAI